MTGQQLKNSILQMAVQGKLVPQDPNDEPASVLLERIRAEKDALIKSGKIKKEKNPSVIFRGADNLPYEKIGNNEPVCIADEVPFEIPDSWEWCRLGSILNKLTDGTHSTPKYVESGIPFISVKDVSSGYLDFSNCKYITKEEHKELYERCNPEQGDILLTKVGTTGIPIIVDTNDEFSLFVSVALLKFNQNLLYNEYLVHLINSPLVQKQATENTKGVGNKNWVMRDIANTLIAIPPLQEQYRIVEEFKKYNIFLLEYDKKENELLRLNNSFPDLLKKSILQEAVQGKLVPQDENDEPASVLLDRIRAEKDALIKSGKIKKDKNESIIFRRDNSHYEKRGSEEVCIDDELPFEIPESWELIRLNDIGIYRKGPFGSSLTKGMFVPKSENSVKVYEQKNAIKKDHTLGNYYITRKYYEEKMQGFAVSPGDIIVSCAGTIGETYVLPDDIEEGIINQALMRMTIFAPIDIEYFLLYFDYVLKQSAIESSKGSAIKNIPPFEIFKKLLLPLPPIQEQRRIVEKIAEINKYCDTL